MRMKLISYWSGYSAVILVHVKYGTCLEVGSPVVDSWGCNQKNCISHIKRQYFVYYCWSIIWPFSLSGRKK
jgi:hypothetical protein